MPLDPTQRAVAARILGRESVELLARPLWEFHPYHRPLVLTARKRRNILQHDPEPIGDPEYA
ncbi:hypothetical protein ABZ192_12620 [Streptomyces sp. NPDC006235]|uniref:hypothetical protein n=1 Tax=Streptomyces sp. NPDC006235 TaxID=3156736 RepID=UPI0033A8931E